MAASFVAANIAQDIDAPQGRGWESTPPGRCSTAIRALLRRSEDVCRRISSSVVLFLCEFAQEGFGHIGCGREVGVGLREEEVALRVCRGPAGLGRVLS